VKDISTLQSKYSNRAQAAAPDYVNGVKNTQKSWSANTVAAAPAWAAGVQAAAQNGSYNKGVTNAGDTKWQTGAVNKGGVRYAPGVQAGAGNWGTNFAPYLQVIAGLNLPPRGPRRSPQNYNRVQMVGQALAAKKTGVAA